MFNNMDMRRQSDRADRQRVDNFGWEYVWHCHILSHEEMDMMRPISVSVPPIAPVITGAVYSGTPSPPDHRELGRQFQEWSPGFTLRRAVSSLGPWTTVANNLAPNTTSYVDILGTARRPLYYQVFATNTVGYSFTPGYSTLATSAGSNMFLVGPSFRPASVTPVPFSPPSPKQIRECA